MKAVWNSLQGGATGRSVVTTKRTKAELQLPIQKRSFLSFKAEAVLRGCISLLLTYLDSVRGYSRLPACGGQL